MTGLIFASVMRPLASPWNSTQQEMEAVITSFHLQKVNSPHDQVDNDDDQHSILTLLPKVSIVTSMSNASASE